MLYEPNMHTKLLGVSSKDEVRIEIKLLVETYDGQEIMVFDPIESGSSPNYSVAIPVAIRGNSDGEKVYQQSVINFTIKSSVNASSLAEVITAVGNDVYTLTATTYMSGSPQ